MNDLIGAYLAARRHRHAHGDLRDHHGARSAAVAAAFAIHLEKPPPSHDGLGELLADVLSRLENLDSPFDGYLEAPKSIAELYHRHGRRIAEANAALRTSLLELAVDLVAAVWRIEPGTTVSYTRIREHGFDMTRPAPDPLDYR